MKYLVLNFRNATLFENNEGKKKLEKTEEGINKFVNYSNNRFKEPITIYQISNVIHVLFGERPVPTFRKVPYSIISKYYKKASDSYLRIDNPLIKYNNGDNDYISEIMHTNKHQWNSTSKSVNINWYKVKKFLTNYATGNDNMFNVFIKDCNLFFNYNVLSKPVNVLKENFIKSKNHQFILSKLTGKKSLIDYLTNKNNDGSGINTSYSYGLMRTNNNGIEMIKKFYGKIYVPVSDEDIEILSNISTGICTLLDGGLVNIESIKEDYEINDDKLVKVSNISIDKK